MADLLSIFANAYPADQNAVMRGMQGAQNFMSNALEYQQKREALEAARGLRALYAQNPNPSYEDIARIDPTFAMQQNKANFELQKEMLGAKKTEREISGMEAKTIAETLGPIAERAMMTGDIEAYKREIGQAASALSSQGVKLPMNFDPEQHTPDMVLQNAIGRGYKSPFMENQAALQREQMMRGLGPQMTPQQAYGDVKMGQYGPIRVPGLGGYNMTPGPQYGVTPFNPNAGQMQQGPMPGGMQQAPIGAEDLAVLKQNRAQMQPGPERDALDRMIGEVETGRIAQPPAGGFVTPQQEMQMRIGEKAAEAGATATAKAEVERTEENKRITDAFKRAVGPGGVSRVMKLISESTSGPTEELAAQVVSGIPRPGGSRATSGMENIGSLTTIAKELSKTIERSPGPQSDKDVLLASLAAAAIDNPSIPYNQRMKGFLEFARLMKERAGSMGIDPKELGIDIDTESGSTSSAQTTTPATLKIGEVKDGYEYIGGNPKDQSSWKKVR